MTFGYQENEQQQKTRLNTFTYYSPEGGQVDRYTEIREQANNLALHLNVSCPPSRELSLAMTKLEEVVMWANAAIARNEK